jgi:16S rRNA processing protein RimM
LEGFLGIYIDPDDLTLLEPGRTVFVEDRLLTVAATRRGDKGYQVAFAEVTDRTGAEQIRGGSVYAAERRHLGEDEFWLEDLLGLEVRPGGGTVVGVAHGPSQSRLVVERAGTRFEIPFVSELVPLVDLDARYVEIADIPGLIEPSSG